MPFFVTRRWGFKIVQLPPFTTYGGPWFHYSQASGSKENNRLSFEHKTMSALISQLPKTFFFKINFRPEIRNWLPFYWEGFRQTTRYTYIFDQTNDLEKITTGFKNTLRSDLKKAEKYAQTCREDAEWQVVFKLNQQSYQRKNLRQPYDLETFKCLNKALQQRNQSACFVAYDNASGKPSAGLYLVFDEKQASILLTGTDPEFKHQSAVYGLFMEAIRFCSARALSLDFEGSMDQNIERAFRAFGARLVPYFQVWKWC
ncbi:MAG: GNAT family N-acetyltransferase [Saprospiraceae bacterium]